ncbi:hypothetical protein BC835DRAFT_677751 [Cytidiella melzeri]|nr:hypothetical protein BC835DRAFT_677751 [Cytidiella melzeri]
MVCFSPSLVYIYSGFPMHATPTVQEIIMQAAVRRSNSSYSYPSICGNSVCENNFLVSFGEGLAGHSTPCDYQSRRTVRSSALLGTYEHAWLAGWAKKTRFGLVACHQVTIS